MKKRILSIVLMLCMVLALMPTMALAGEEADEAAVDAAYDAADASDELTPEEPAPEPEPEPEPAPEPAPEPEPEPAPEPEPEQTDEAAAAAAYDVLPPALDGDTDGDFEYSVSDGEVTITGYTGSGGAVTIPSEIGGNPVTAIGNNAFKDNKSITSVTIQSGVKTIGEQAFMGCTSLTSVSIPDSVTSIEKNAFNNCYQLTSVTIGNGVTSIGNGAFQNCRSLTSVTIQSGVKTIGEQAFMGCTSLTNVSIPDSVTTIGEYAFNNCYQLTSVTIPGSVQTIGECAFIYCSGLTSVTIGNGVTSIGNGAFNNCISLTSITIPGSVASIGTTAFTQCSSLTSIEVDASNTAFSSSDGVLFNQDKTVLVRYPEGKTDTSYNIPDSVTSIGDHAFQLCRSLTSITIPGSVTTIGASAFAECESLTSIEIPDSVTSIGAHAFYRCASLTSITIPDSVTSIGDSAFSECRSLASITIPDSVTTIGGSAFCNCRSLASITIPDSVRSIGGYAFYNCTSLGVIFLPDGLDVSNAEIPAGATQVRYSVSDGKVTITAIALGSGKNSVDIPATIGGCEVVAVVVSEQPKVGEHTHAGGTATCQTAGTCGLCGNPYYLPHDFSAENTTSEALKTAGTCQTEAVYYYSCIYCDLVEGNDDHTFTGEKDPANHVGGTEIRDAKAATCAEEGYTGDTYCTGCGAKLSDGEPIEKPAHAYEWQSENGQYWQKCRDCGDETAKQAVPAITIEGADAACVTQDYKFSFTLPEGMTATYGFDFGFKGDGGYVPTNENGTLYGVIASEILNVDAESFEVLVNVSTADGYAFHVSKTVALQSEHTDAEPKDAVCDVCGAALQPEIIEGMGQSVTAGEEKDLAFRSNAAFDHFLRVEVDGETLGEENYTAEEGSTIVTLKADYVAALSVGEHTLGIVSEGGTAVTTFTVKEKPAETEKPVETQKPAKPADKKPLATGDNSDPALWLALLLVTGVLLTGVYGRKKRNVK